MEEIKEVQSSAITLPEGKTFSDLDEAHQADLKDGGNREENLYPLEQSQLDNSASYLSEMTLADTKELIDKLKSRLQALKGNGEGTEENEFDVRTGYDEDTRQDIEENITKKEEGFDYVKTISGLKDRNNINRWLAFAESDLDKGKITPSKLQEIREAADVKLEELSVEIAKEYVGIISRQITKYDIDKWVDMAGNDVNRGEITSLQLQEIREAANAKIKELGAEITTDHVSMINKLEDKDHVQAWLDSAKSSLERGEIANSQFQEIQNAALNKTAEIREGAGGI